MIQFGPELKNAVDSHPAAIWLVPVADFAPRQEDPADLCGSQNRFVSENVDLPMGSKSACNTSLLWSKQRAMALVAQCMPPDQTNTMEEFCSHSSLHAREGNTADTDDGVS